MEVSLSLNSIHGFSFSSSKDHFFFTKLLGWLLSALSRLCFVWLYLLDLVLGLFEFQLGLISWYFLKIGFLFIYIYWPDMLWHNKQNKQSSYVWFSYCQLRPKTETFNKNENFWSFPILDRFWFLGLSLSLDLQIPLSPSLEFWNWVLNFPGSMFLADYSLY
jgi:hypothetical protein